jgi:hypothetical protein
MRSTIVGFKRACSTLEYEYPQNTSDLVDCPDSGWIFEHTVEEAREIFAPYKEVVELCLGHSQYHFETAHVNHLLKIIQFINCRELRIDFKGATLPLRGKFEQEFIEKSPSSPQESVHLGFEECNLNSDNMAFVKDIVSAFPEKKIHLDFSGSTFDDAFFILDFIHNTDWLTGLNLKNIKGRGPDKRAAFTARHLSCIAEIMRRQVHLRSIDLSGSLIGSMKHFETFECLKELGKGILGCASELGLVLCIDRLCFMDLESQLAQLTHDSKVTIHSEIHPPLMDMDRGCLSIYSQAHPYVNLNFDGQTLDEEQVLQLASSLSHFKKCADNLSLSLAFSTFASLTVILEIIQECDSLLYLNLNGTKVVQPGYSTTSGLSEVHWIALATLLKRNKRLVHLNISNQTFKSSGLDTCQLLCRAIEDSHLKSLFAVWTNMKSYQIYDLLTSNKHTLQELIFDSSPSARECHVKSPLRALKNVVAKKGFIGVTHHQLLAVNDPHLFSSTKIFLRSRDADKIAEFIKRDSAVLKSVNKIARRSATEALVICLMERQYLLPKDLINEILKELPDTSCEVWLNALRTSD